MAQHEIEVILARHLAEQLVMPIFIVSPSGDLLFYNESAEPILGCRYDETGVMLASELASLFQTVDQDGKPMNPEDLPIMIALTQRHPAHNRFWIRGLDGALRQIEVTAFPLNAQAHRFLGAVAIFWEVKE
jgi:PAS domain-containing protein